MISLICEIWKTTNVQTKQSEDRLKDTENKWAWPEGRGERCWVKNVKGIKRYKLVVTQWISHGDVKNSIGNQATILQYICITDGYYTYHDDHSYEEKVMALHSSIPAWRIPWMEEPGRLQSMRSLRIRHNWATSLSLFTFMHWRRKWQPTPVFLPRESQRQMSPVGCHLWGHTESDTTAATKHQQQHFIWTSMMYPDSTSIKKTTKPTADSCWYLVETNTIL